MNRIVIGLAAVTLWIPLASGQVQDKTIQSLEKRLADQEKRLADLERQLSDQRLSQAQKEEVIKLIKEISADASRQSALPTWLKDLKFSGDLRLRYQAHVFNDDTKNRNRGRFRLRFGFVKTFLDNQMEVGFRLGSGETRLVDGAPLGQDASSPNQSFTDNFSRKPIWIDLVYAKYRPKQIKGLTILGGKMQTPMVHTDLTWDSDINPEGVYAHYQPEFGAFQPFIGSGYFVAVESRTGHDATLAAYQAGLDWDVMRSIKGQALPKDAPLGTLSRLLWTTAVTYYDFDHLDRAFLAGTTNMIPVGNPDVGGVLTAGEFQMINITNRFTFDLLRIPVTPYLDYVYNCGDEDQSEEFDNQNNAFSVGFRVGANKKQGDLSFDYRYAYVEANAVPGTFTDSDFGGANRKGHVWRVVYNLTDFLTAGATVFWTEPVAGTAENERRTDIRADLIWKF